jgi:hypothetical protein
MQAADTILALLEALEVLADEPVLGHASYCEVCEAHAPKDHGGNLTGPVEHREGCSVGMAKAAIAMVRGGSQ